MSSSFSSSTNDPSRNLVRPSPSVPWDVSIIHKVPPILLEDVISKQKVAAYDSFENVQAIMSVDGKICLIKHSPSDSSSDIYQSLYHPLLNRSQSLLLSMSGDEDSYFVFAFNVTTGYLAAWCLPRNAPPSLLAKTPSCKLRFSNNNVSSSAAGAVGPIVLLKAFGRRLLLGSANGLVWCCTMSERPMVLTATEWTRSNSSLWNRIFSSSTLLSSSSNSLQSPVVAFLPGSYKNNEVFFYSITQSGHIEAWYLETGRLVCRLHDLIENAVEDDFDAIEVLHASTPSSLASDDQSDTVVLDIIVKLIRPRRARMYFLRFADDKLHQCLWLNRFPDSVPCHGITSCDNGITYACFGSSPVTVLALGAGDVNNDSTSTIKIHEVDLPNEEAPNIIGLGKDMETHGVSMLTTVGLILRVRWMQLQATVVSTSDEEVQVLARHLRVAFWNHYQMKTVPLPPSLTSSSWTTRNMEAAIILAARQLQREGDGSSSHNAMEWHFAFLRLLKEAGWYKNLSSSGRWTLLGIGQELAIHSVLVTCNLFSKDLPPYGLASKISQVQLHVLNHSPTMEWSIALQKVLEAAMKYRDQQALTTYDVLTDPRNLWIHELKDTLLLQLKHPESAKLETLGVIVAAALQVHRETKSKDYSLVKTIGMDLIRNNLKNDKLAYDLSLEHEYYEGLCQLAIDKPVEYSLEPILTKWDDFGLFALTWFAQQGHHGKALSYGKLLPLAFGELVEAHLPEYRWVHALRLKDYGGASDALFQNASGQNMEYTEWHLSMAKLTAKVHTLEKKKSGNHKRPKSEDNAGNDRLKRIDNKLDLLKAQRALIPGENHVPLQTPEYLLKLASDKFDAAATDIVESDQVVYYAIMGLIIARACDNLDGIASVWSKVIAVDLVDKWSFWIRSTPPPSRSTIIQDTVFGQVWKLVHAQESQSSDPISLSSKMQYHNDLADLVVHKLPSLDRGAARELKRLLSLAITVVHESSSIMAGNIEDQ